VASELFNELYEKAIRREHSKLLGTEALMRYFDPNASIVAAGKVAAGMDELSLEFEDNIRVVARNARMRTRKVEYRCMLCGQPTCLAAQPVVFIHGDPTGFMAHLLAGGSPYQYEE